MPIDTFIDNVYGVIAARKVEDMWQFLVIKSRKGNWGFPKGHPNPGETPVQTATREFQEETGISGITLYEDVHFNSSHAVANEARVVTKIITWFLGIVTSDAKSNPIDYEEVVETRWLSFSDAFIKLTHPESKQILLDAKEYLLKNKL